MKKYEKYKNSGVDWLREVPKHWEIKKLKSGYFFEKGKNAGIFKKEYINDPSKKGEYPVYSGQTANEGVMGKINTYIYDLNEAIFVTTVGAKVMTPMILRGKFSLSQNCALFIKRTNDINDRFFYYQLFPLFSRMKDDIPSYMQPSLRISDLNKYAVVFPLFKEQQKITTFLDKKVKQIENFIKNKQKLIDLLEEEKKTIITNAVTKGINPKVNYKNSGIEWIGEIPDDWQVIPNKYIFKEINERSKKGLEIHLSMSQKIGVVPAKDIAKSLESESYKGAKLVFKNDLVLNRLKAHLAVFSPSSYDGLVSPDYSVFRLLSSEFQISYFSNLFRTPNYLTELNRKVKGIVVGFLRLYSDDFNAIPSIVPPAQQQQKIVTYIEKESKKIDDLKEKYQKEIDLIKEYKEILIYDVVTGKMNVQDYEIH